jgi:hypothetical protein
VLALVALAMQLVASFGHVHLEDDCLAAGHGLRTLKGDVGPVAHHDPHTCSVCLTVAILGSSVEPAPPALPLPELPAADQAIAPSKQLVLGAVRLGFSARAPPSSSQNS